MCIVVLERSRKVLEKVSESPWNSKVTEEGVWYSVPCGTSVSLSVCQLNNLNVYDRRPLIETRQPEFKHFLDLMMDLKMFYFLCCLYY